MAVRRGLTAVHKTGLLAIMMLLSEATDEYLGWLQIERNRSPHTLRAYRQELARLTVFLASRGHTLKVGDLGRTDLRAYQQHLARSLTQPSSRARALVAVRSWLRWLASEGTLESDISGSITLPKQPQRLPKPIEAQELTGLLTGLLSETPKDKRDKALVLFLLSTGCRISEALALERYEVPRQGNRLVVTGKGDKQRSVYLTESAKKALDDYLLCRTDTSPALFINYDRSAADSNQRRLTSSGARYLVRRIRAETATWSFKSPHVARHTAATNLLEVTGGDVRLVQEVLGHANLNTLQGYTKIVDQKKVEAYRRYEERLGAAEPL